LVGRLRLTPRHVYEVGAGSGYWTKYWQSLGADVSGCDFSPEAIAKLEPLGRFELLDISAQQPAGSYDLVWVADVLLHILDGGHFRQALMNIAAIVETDGVLIMLEPAQVAKYQEFPRDGYSMARPLEAYLEPLLAAGLVLVEMEPATAIANNPIEASSELRYRAWLAVWNALKVPTRITVRAGALMGAMAYFLDPLVLHSVGGVSSKLVVLRRPHESGSVAHNLPVVT
jgi:SAM-dependent methyltransferase